MNRSTWAKAVRERDNNTCVVCGALGTNAHHMLCEGYFDALSLSIDNGITLCRSCHVLAHRGKFGASGKGKYPPYEAITRLLDRAQSDDKMPIIVRIIQADIENENAAMRAKKKR